MYIEGLGRYYDGVQGVTILDSIIISILYMPFANEFGEGGAFIERTASNACYGVGDGDGGEG